MKYFFPVQSPANSLRRTLWRILLIRHLRGLRVMSEKYSGRRQTSQWGAGLEEEKGQKLEQEDSKKQEWAVFIHQRRGKKPRPRRIKSEACPEYKVNKDLRSCRMAPGCLCPSYSLFLPPCCCLPYPLLIVVRWRSSKIFVAKRWSGGLRVQIFPSTHDISGRSLARS